MALTLLQQVQNALQTPMAALSEMDYEAEFSDSAIYFTLADAVEDYNVEFDTTLTTSVTTNESGAATGITITATPTARVNRVIALQASFLLIDEWVRINLMNGELGVAVRDGLGSINTQGRATHATKMVQRAAARVRRVVARTKIRASLSSSSMSQPGEDN